jgi:hypothetical protein
MTIKAKFVTEIKLLDPDTYGAVHLSVYKHQNGGMFAIDSSFIEQVLDEDEPIQDPLNCKGKIQLIE